MKQIVCETCGGKDLVKQDGMFICQSCGSKYSVEEAKKMMVEVDNSAKLTNALEKARRAMENKNYGPAQEYYEIILKEEPDNWEAFFYSVYSKKMQKITSYEFFDALIDNDSIKTILKNIKILDDIAQQNKAIEQVKTDLFTWTSEVYKIVLIDRYNSLKSTFEGYDKSLLGSIFSSEKDDVLEDKVISKITYTNLTRDNALIYFGQLIFFGNELVSEFGKNEFTNSINIQCYEIALNTLKKLYNETFTVPAFFIKGCGEYKPGESKFLSTLQRYTDELENIKPPSEVPKTTAEQSPLFANIKPEKSRDFSFLIKPLISDTGCGCFPAGCFSFVTTPIFIIGIVVITIIGVIVPEESQTQNVYKKNEEQINYEARATANLLYGDLKDANTINSKECTSGKPIQLRGSIKDVNTSYVDINPNIRAFFVCDAVSCNETKGKNLRSGGQIKIAGECQGQKGNKIIIENAVIVN
jgi:uncharacterized Zn finger protein (UPF0148 family)